MFHLASKKQGPMTVLHQVNEASVHIRLFTKMCSLSQLMHTEGLMENSVSRKNRPMLTSTIIHVTDFFVCSYVDYVVLKIKEIIVIPDDNNNLLSTFKISKVDTQPEPNL